MNDLLARVHDAPDDDTAKLVVADALLERKDPRGEFIALQFKGWRGEATKEDRARVSALLSKHRAAWLGPLADVLDPDSLVFEKGFLRQGALLEWACAANVTETWVEAPALRELRELVMPDLGAAELAGLLERQQLRHLLGPRLSSTRALQALATREWPFGSFGARGTVKALSAALVTVATGKAFGSVRRVVLSLERFGRSSVAEVMRTLSKHALQARFDELHLESTNNDAGAAGYALTSLSRFAPKAVAAVALPHLSARLAAGALVVRAGAIASHVFEFLHGFDVQGVTLVVHQAGGALPGESDLDGLKNDLRRLRPARAVFPAEWGTVDV
ncbi:MAG: TIGR02996 domain-containing protein [Archangium sp.]|nr:TIGR02996 domain-containing protein [Archangium sp.]